MNVPRRILVTGGTGYVGSRLIPLLRERGDDLHLRLMARKPEYLRSRVGDGYEIVAGDVTELETLRAALADIDTAYYLIHSMGSGQDFKERTDWQRETLPTQRVQMASVASSISVALESRTNYCRSTCVVVMKLVKSCRNPVLR